MDHLVILSSCQGMRAVIQRVTEASVTVNNQVVGQIGGGLLVLLGIGVGDQLAAAMQMAEKIANMRIFADDDGRFNRSALDVGGAALVVSQFTLYADTRRGRDRRSAGRCLRGGAACARPDGGERRLRRTYAGDSAQRWAGDDCA